uniref:HTH merR-type domain-containing protein n=1 Tax=Thermosporothrix sp. COM3 TaxID=2490863 RepID=A0A455SEC2_9CHLR|nr:hypothetical protein KTC_01300 [Thermosporothrix sp. COM3]
MERQHYTTSQFARKAAVTARTLRFYDKVGLLSPSAYTEAGHRLYTDEDLWSLQQILALKYLGLSLEEIKVCLQKQPERLQETLAMQKEIIREKRSQLDAVLQALEQAEVWLKRDQGDLETILVDVIQVIQLEQKNAWMKKYLTEEQRQKLEEIARKSYSPEATRKLAARAENWTEEDQHRARQQWDTVFVELKRLVAEGKDPTGVEGQALAKQHCELIQQLTLGDADIAASAMRWWENYERLPLEEKPFPLYHSTEEEKAFLQQALAHYKRNLGMECSQD